MIVVLKVTLVFALALACVTLARRAAASTRHLILVAAQLAALTVPLLTFLVPPLKLDAPIVSGTPASTPTGLAASPPPLSLPSAEPSSPRPSLWLLGTLAMLSTQCAAFLRARRLVHRAVPFRDALISNEVEQPVTLGSRIVLPPAAASWDEAKLEAVLLHERAHVARRDSLLGAIADVCLAVYWFHPLAWLVVRRANVERERACDDAVLARGIAADAYAQAILDIARGLVQRRTLGIAMAGRSHLAERIHAILDPSQHARAARATRTMVIVIALAAAPVLAALTLRGGEPDLRGDFVASPFSERIPLPSTIPSVEATGPDAALIATMQQLAAREPQHEIDFVPERARWALLQVRHGELVAPLIEALHDGDWRVQAYAAFGLSIARDRRATRELVALTAHPVWRVRAIAATALANGADPAAAHAMEPLLEDDAWQVRHGAVRYFAALGRRDLLEKKTEDRHVAVRTAAMEGLQ
ncbi:MAG TPA: M56 family metallopeptidase [Thermoanaerobaculia bacterium]|nr:M56 family metallopeptidase [Thermoanaerobaculia bacterium]